ncbi:unnamed protein product [Thlaspi arvense]|uniref:Uncharacterized protein n=1 Tax=Thlaspi arvense TaxID=13288 RepID=A0AAU9RPM9_THLAR|nr:unnamed protein product [Thlaspi arvense]
MGTMPSPGLPLSSSLPLAKVNAWSSGIKNPILSSVPIVSMFQISNEIVSVRITDKIYSDFNPLWKSFALGYFINEAPHVGTIYATINQIWTHQDIDESDELEETDDLEEGEVDTSTDTADVAETVQVVFGEGDKVKAQSAHDKAHTKTPKKHIVRMQDLKFMGTQGTTKTASTRRLCRLSLLGTCVGLISHASTRQ